MADQRPYTKKELKFLLTNLGRKGITDDMIDRLIETLWRNKFTMRTSGFANAGGPDAVISFNNADRKFTIAPLDPDVETYVPRFSFYTWSYTADYQQRFAAEEIQLPADEGLYCIYYDTDEVNRFHQLFYIKNPDELALKNLYYTKVIVAFLYWDSDANEAIYFGDDRHGSEWIPSMHSYLHNAFHARRKSGLQLQDLTINGDGSDDAHARVSVSAGEIYHDDIELEIPASGYAIPILSKIGGVPRFFTSAYAILKGASRICYNNGVANIEADNNYHVIYHLFATNEILTESRKTISVMGVGQYEFLADAYAAMDTELDSFSYMPHQGRCYLGSIIVQTSDDFTNTMHARVVGVIGDGIKFHPPVTIHPDSVNSLEIDEKQVIRFIGSTGSSATWHIEAGEVDVTTQTMTIPFSGAFNAIPIGAKDLKVFRIYNDGGELIKQDQIPFHFSSGWLTTTGFTITIDDGYDYTGCKVGYEFKEKL